MNAPAIVRLLRRGIGSIATLGAIALASCSDPGVRIEGQLLNADGFPAAGVAVTFHLNRVGSEGSDQLDTDADGHYAFVTHAAPEDDGALVASLWFETGPGATAIVSVATRGEDVTVPPVRFWAAELTAADGASAGELTWAKSPDGTPPHYQVYLYQGRLDSSATSFWTPPATDDQRFDVPAEVVEDRFATAEVLAGDLDCSNPLDATGICVWQRSRRVLLPIGADVPLSRGATCSAGVGGVETPLLTLGGPPCPLTDGLASTTLPACYSELCPTDVVVDLGVAAEIHTVAVHGAVLSSAAGTDGDLVLETSPDGVVFTELGHTSAESYRDTDWMLRLTQPVTARAVRLRATPSSLLTLTELAVF